MGRISRLGALILLVSLPSLAGCVGYPRVFLARKSGRASTDGGPPVIKASIVRSSQGTPTRMLGAVIDLTSVAEELPVVSV